MFVPLETRRRSLTGYLHGPLKLANWGTGAAHEAGQSASIKVSNYYMYFDYCNYQGNATKVLLFSMPGSVHDMNGEFL
jgi:hypothetical protein